MFLHILIMGFIYIKNFNVVLFCLSLFWCNCNLYAYSHLILISTPAPAWPSQGTKDSLNVRSAVRVCTLLVPWPWFCWAARHNKATSHSPPDQWLFSISTSILILIDVWRRRLCICWESHQQTWSPSKIGKLTLHAKIFTDLQILEDLYSVPM